MDSNELHKFILCLCILSKRKGFGLVPVFNNMLAKTTWLLDTYLMALAVEP